jgi:hypothetical protein
MADRRDVTYALSISPNTSTVIGPVACRQTARFTFTLRYSITAGTVTDATMTVRASNLGRGANPPPTVALQSLVVPNPQPGFSINEGGGVITCNASTIGAYEQTWRVVGDIPSHVWFDWQYNSGGGLVTANLVIGAWSL